MKISTIKVELINDDTGEGSVVASFYVEIHARQTLSQIISENLLTKKLLDKVCMIATREVEE
jgi:hypothetical protein